MIVGVHLWLMCRGAGWEQKILLTYIHFGFRNSTNAAVLESLSGLAPR